VSELKERITGRLGDLLPLKYGKSLPAAVRDSTGSVPVYGSSGVVGSHSYALTTGPVIVVGRKGNVGAVHYSAVPCWPIDTAYFAEPPMGHDPRYYRYLLDSLGLARLDKSTAIPGLSRDDYNAVEVTIHPPEQQVEVVAKIETQFSRLDEAVANLQRVKANLKRYKDSIYAEAFRNSPNCTLGDLIEGGPQNGLYLPKDMYGAGVPILRIDDYQTAWIRPVQELRRVKASVDQISTWGLSEDDLVVNRVNSMTHLGKCVRVPKSLARAVFESNMMRIRLRTTISPAYVEHYLASRLGKKRLTENAKWAVNQASINQKDVRATPIFLPDLNEQLRVVAEVDRHLSIVREVEADVDANRKRAQALRQTTLIKAFSFT
jgi:type I restriction enzyme S subunit